MDLDILAVFGSIFVIVTTLGAMTLSGWRYWVRSKANLPVDRVTPALQDAIRYEIERALAVRDRELAEIHERLDFAERLLSRPGSGGGEKPQ